jgi:hypothetical protein
MGKITLNLVNHTEQAVETTLWLRSGTQFTPQVVPVIQPNQGQTSAVLLQPDEDVPISQTFTPASGLFTEINAAVSLGSSLNLSGVHCTVENQFIGLPNVNWILFFIPLTGLGILLCLPWVIQPKHRRDLGLMIGLILVTLLCIYLERYLLLTHHGS